MKMYADDDAYLHTFLTSVLHGGEWFSFTFWSPYHGAAPQRPLGGRLSGPESQYERGREE
jgi:hypothetical protein